MAAVLTEQIFSGGSSHRTKLRYTLVLINLVPKKRVVFRIFLTIRNCMKNIHSILDNSISNCFHLRPVQLVVASTVKNFRFFLRGNVMSTSNNCIVYKICIQNLQGWLNDLKNLAYVLKLPTFKMFPSSGKK